MKKLLTSLIFAFTVSSSFALETTVQVSDSKCDTTAPCVVIKNSATLLSDAMNADKSKQETINLIKTGILPKINFKQVTMRSLGEHWKQATPEQQDQLTELFQQLLVNTYATATSKFNGSTINILSTQVSDDNKKAIVKTSIALPPTSDGKTKSVSIEYNLTNSGKDDWKIIDVKIENISLIVTYRTQFDEIINKDGIDGLINQLQTKVNSLKK